MCGCLGLYRNHRIIEQGNIKAYGNRFIGPIRYDYISIGTPEKPWDGQSMFSIILHDNTHLQSSDFSLEQIEAHTTNSWIYPEVRGGFPKGSKSFSTPNFRFLFSESDQLVSFSARVPKKDKSAGPTLLGTYDGSIFYNLPLNEAQVHKLFGTNFIVSSYDFRL